MSGISFESQSDLKTMIGDTSSFIIDSLKTELKKLNMEGRLDTNLKNIVVEISTIDQNINKLLNELISKTAGNAEFKTQLDTLRTELLKLQFNILMKKLQKNTLTFDPKIIQPFVTELTRKMIKLNEINEQNVSTIGRVESLPASLPASTPVTSVARTASLPQSLSSYNPVKLTR